MNRFGISNLAEKDLKDIWFYLAQENEILADKKIAQIFNLARITSILVFNYVPPEKYAVLGT